MILGQDFPLDPFANDPRAEVCVHCRGTALSGPFYECDSCSAVAVHWHCFRDMGLEPLNGRWICDNCCEVSNPYVYMYVCMYVCKFANKKMLDVFFLIQNLQA